MQTIAERLQSALENIQTAAEQSARDPADIQLLAVSKTKPETDIVSAYEAGQRIFGENYVQEGITKIQSLQELSDIEWHMLGPVQSNKTALVAEHFDWVQSVDRVKIARRLNDQRHPYKPPLQVCIQVNISGEGSKFGASGEDVTALAQAIDTMPRLALRGLMGIPAPSTRFETQKQAVVPLVDLFNQLKVQYPHLDTLSMGMSADLHAAIDAGSTMVRLGTAIFGPRPPKE